MRDATRPGREDRSRPTGDAARKRAAVEMIARHEQTLKRTARRYSLDLEDAEDAYQRALEIVLTKAPTTDSRELIRWTQTVTKHEALALRRSRERMLGYPRPRGRDGEPLDPVALIPADADGPDEQAERREDIARSREALRALKPAELRSLTLLAEGYSYAEISERTGFSLTKINRCLAEGRERFRSLLSSGEDGSRCRELRPLLSAFCDGEARAEEAAAVREHLRACAHCRATMRTYRAAPRVAAGLVPLLSGSRSLFEQLRDAFGSLASRLPGIGAGTDATATQIAAAGGSRGAGMAALAKLLAICAGAAGGAACVATGVVPGPLDLLPAQHAKKPAIERTANDPADAAAGDAVHYEPAPPAPVPQPKPKPPPRHQPQSEPEYSGNEAVDTAAEPVEYEAPPAAPPVAAAPIGGEGSSSSSSSASAAGEFGP